MKLSDWLNYPANKPPSDDPTWYLVELDDGSQCQACAWWDDWYCFIESHRIVKFFQPRVANVADTF